MKFPIMFSRPSAFVPIIMSAAALTLVLVSVFIFGAAHESDEGAVAHLWQILIAGQLPVVVFLAIRWLRQAPKLAFPVLGVQAVAFVAALAPVYFLNL
jgi:hypothetical protein